MYKPGVQGTGSILAFACLSFLINDIIALLIFAAGLFLIISLFDRSALGIFLDLKVLFFVAVTLITVPWIIKGNQGWILAVQLVVKGLIILSSSFYFARSMSIRELTGLFSRMGLTRLGFILGIAFNALPVIERTWSAGLISLKIKGGLKRRKLKSLKQLTLNLVINLLKYADDVHATARIKQFDPLHPPRISISRSRMDVPVSVYLLILYSLVIFIN